MKPSENPNDSASPQQSAAQALPWQFERRIPSDPDYCAKIVALVLEQLARFKWSNRDVFAIHMAMEESILNAIRHGNRCSPNKQVHIRIQVNQQEFYSCVTDEGEGFKLEEVPDPTLEENLENPSGRGVMLIQTFMDQVVYNEKGNSVQLFKQRRDSDE